MSAWDNLVAEAEEAVRNEFVGGGDNSSLASDTADSMTPIFDSDLLELADDEEIASYRDFFFDFDGGDISDLQQALITAISQACESMLQDRLETLVEELEDEFEDSVERKCEQCGDEYNKDETDEEDEPERFCSLDCSNQYYEIGV